MTTLSSSRGSHNIRFLLHEGLFDETVIAVGQNGPRFHGPSMSYPSVNKEGRSYLNKDPDDPDTDDFLPS